MIKQIIEGMCYLASRRIVHRDLAARNCMLSAHAQTIKITDFGLSRKLTVQDCYLQRPDSEFPMAWTALECLSNGPVGFFAFCLHSLI